MQNILKDYDKFINAKLYLIEHIINQSLYKQSSDNNYKDTLLEIRKVCYGNYNEILARFEKMKEEI